LDIPEVELHQEKCATNSCHYDFFDHLLAVALTADKPRKVRHMDVQILADVGGIGVNFQNRVLGEAHLDLVMRPRGCKEVDAVGVS
jgi:hypothetical protein